MKRRTTLWVLVAALAISVGPAVFAQEIKIGLILPMTGPFTSTVAREPAAIRT